MSSRRNFFIRTFAAVAGDLAVGTALASACAWVIQTAALGLFLSFVLWLLALIATLAVSQHVVHPLTNALLSDTKLDDAVEAVQDLAHHVVRFAQGSSAPAWNYLRRRVGTQFAR